MRGIPYNLTAPLGFSLKMTYKNTSNEASLEASNITDNPTEEEDISIETVVIYHSKVGVQNKKVLILMNHVIWCRQLILFGQKIGKE